MHTQRAAIYRRAVEVFDSCACSGIIDHLHYSASQSLTRATVELERGVSDLAEVPEDTGQLKPGHRGGKVSDVDTSRRGGLLCGSDGCNGDSAGHRSTLWPTEPTLWT